METNSKFPLYLPGKTCSGNADSGILSLDVRLNNCWVGIYSCKEGVVTREKIMIYENALFSSLSELISQLSKDTGIPSHYRLSLALPGPIINGRCETPNLPWFIDLEDIRSQTEFRDIYLINDLEAAAYNLTSLENEDFMIIHHSNSYSKGNVAILAPGHGLGETGLYYDGHYLRPFATEGGHSEFSPRNDFEVKFYQFLNKIYGIVTWENVLSERGIYDIYRFLRDVGGHTEDPKTQSQIQQLGFLDTLKDRSSKDSCRLMNQTLDMFFEFLAREANHLVLKLKATGGLIITGEIINKLGHLIDTEKFYQDFSISTRMEHLLKDTPIYMLKTENSILNGAANYAAFMHKR